MQVSAYKLCRSLRKKQQAVSFFLRLRPETKKRPQKAAAVFEVVFSVYVAISGNIRTGFKSCPPFQPAYQPQPCGRQSILDTVLMPAYFVK